MFNKKKIELFTMKRVLLLITLLFTFNTLFAQKALKILKDDGSITYINASAVNKITFVDTLAIGDTHEGGIIFYLDANGEHGLIAAATNQSSGIRWDNDTITTTDATKDTLGAGEVNTYMIVAKYGSGSYAAKLCDDLTLGGYTDWYLPSKYELNLMYTNLRKASPTPLGGFGNNVYWSSNEYNSSTAWAQYFKNGDQFSDKKAVGYAVRAVRAF